MPNSTRNPGIMRKLRLVLSDSSPNPLVLTGLVNFRVVASLDRKQKERRMKPAKRDKTRLEDFSDEELDAFGEGARGLLVEAELKIRLARDEMARIQEELDFRKAGTPRRPIKYWEDGTRKPRTWRKAVALTWTTLPKLHSNSPRKRKEQRASLGRPICRPKIPTNTPRTVPDAASEPRKALRNLAYKWPTNRPLCRFCRFLDLIFL